MNANIIISIHAPPRGATTQLLVLATPILYFNSRPSARGDEYSSFVSCTGVLFQFTPLREGRHLWRCLRCPEHKFQFTPLREGRRETGIHMRDCERISIHAPPRGATITRLRSNLTSVFQFTPLREGRLSLSSLRLADVFYFNSRPSARGDGKRYAISANLLFNPYKSAWLNNSATQFVEIILVIFHRIIA